MAQNEMKAKAGLPERVRLSEGLGNTLRCRVRMGFEAQINCSHQTKNVLFVMLQVRHEDALAIVLQRTQSVDPVSECSNVFGFENA